MLDAILLRADAFRNDVLNQVRAVQAKQKLSTHSFQRALDLVKANRRKPVAELIELATGGIIRLKT